MTPTEIADLQESLRVLVPTIGSVAVKKFLDVPWATQNVLRYSEEGKVVKFYQGDKFCGILVFDYGKAWWTSSNILYEVVVLSCNNVHGLQRAACRMLDSLAKEYHASLVSSGCFFQEHPQIVTNCYKKFGYAETYPTYAKVMNNDNQ